MGIWALARRAQRAAEAATVEPRKAGLVSQRLADTVSPAVFVVIFVGAASYLSAIGAFHRPWARSTAASRSGLPRVPWRP
jgi:hypothetical protein